jgi:hypothetical protein
MDYLWFATINILTEFLHTPNPVNGGSGPISQKENKLSK